MKTHIFTVNDSFGGCVGSQVIAPTIHEAARQVGVRKMPKSWRADNCASNIFTFIREDGKEYTNYIIF